MKETVENILLRVCGSTALEPAADLIDSGALDSLAFIELLEELEDIGVEIQPTQVDKNEFRTVEGIVKIAEQCQLQQSLAN